MEDAEKRIASDAAAALPLGRSDRATADRADTAATTTEDEAPPSAAPDGGVQAWLFVVAGWLIELMVWGVAYAAGTLQDYHEHDPASPFYGSSVTALSSVGTLVIACQHLVPLLTYGFISARPHLVKPVALACVVASALCLVVASFATSIGLLILFQGVLFGLVGGFLFIPVIMWLPQWFDRRRGLATGMFLCGSGIGGIVFPLVFNALLTRTGFRWTLRIWALLHLVLAGAAVSLIRPRIQPARSKGPLRLRCLLPPSIRFVLDRRFIFFVAIIFFQSFGWYSASLYISPYTSSHCLGSGSATAVLATFNALATVGYLATGSVVDRIAYPLVIAVSMAVCGLAAVLVLGFAESLALIMVFAIIFGFAGGGFSCHITPMSRSLSERRSVPFTLAFFTIMAFRAVAVVAGPLIASALYPGDDAFVGQAGKRTGSVGYGRGGYVGMVVFIGIASFLTAASALLLFWQERRDRRQVAPIKGTETPSSTSSCRR